MHAQSELTADVKLSSYTAAEIANLLSSAFRGVPELLTQLYGDAVIPP